MSNIIPLQFANQLTGNQGRMLVETKYRVCDAVELQVMCDTKVSGHNSGSKRTKTQSEFSLIFSLFSYQPERSGLNQG